MLLLQILSDHLNSRQTKPFDTDWADLLSLSKKHEVAAIVYYQCNRFIPKPYLSEFISAYSSALFFSANRANIVVRIDNVLADIQHFTVKGASVSKYYPYPAFRTMGDTDIVVRTTDRINAGKRLEKIGLKCISCLEDHEWQYYKDGMEFELHDQLVYPGAVTVSKHRQFFNDFWKYVNGDELDWNFHLLFLILHIRKHFMNSGVGFRQFLDIAVLVSRGPVFNWSWIKIELENLGLLGFSECVFALVEYWFNITTPISISPPPKSFFSSATELIGKNGVFGFDNEENQRNVAVNSLRDRKYSRVFMLKRLLRDLFPSYKTLITIPTYTYLKEKLWLLPFVWIHRAFRSIKKKRVLQDVKSLILRSFSDKKTIEKREAIYKEWRL